MQLKTRAGIIFRNYEKSIDGFISTSNSEQKNKQTKKNMSFIAVYHKFT